MNNYRFKHENMVNIKRGFLEKIHDGAGEISVIPQARVIRKSVIAAVAAAVIILSTAIVSIATGFNPMIAWQGLFGSESAIELDKQVVSSGISMSIQSLYTDGHEAVLKMTLRDLEEDRLTGKIGLRTSNLSKFWYSIIDSYRDEETGEVVCVVFLMLHGDTWSVGETLTLIVTSIFADDWSNEYHGNWSFEIDLTAVDGSSISESVELPDHPEFSRASYRLSPMYFEAEVALPIHFPIPDFPEGWLDDYDYVDIWMDYRKIVDEIGFKREFAIVFKDGTRIEPERGKNPFDPPNLFMGQTHYGPDELSGGTQIISWHILNGDFDIEDVAEVIIFGVRFER